MNTSDLPTATELLDRFTAVPGEKVQPQTDPPRRKRRKDPVCLVLSHEDQLQLDFIEDKIRSYPENHQMQDVLADMFEKPFKQIADIIRRL